ALPFEPTVAASSEQTASHAHRSFCIVAQRPYPWSAATCTSHSSFEPFATTALPFVWTSHISFSAFAFGYPNSFWNTHVTYDIRLIGSFHTITIHGMSGSTTSPASGRSTWTGAVPPLTRSRPRC